VNFDKIWRFKKFGIWKKLCKNNYCGEILLQKLDYEKIKYFFEQ
jgi:hypothetical protein